jgi:hypothetical protein
LCLAIVGLPQVRNHLLEGMQAAALRHTEMNRELATLRVAVSSVVESVLGCSPDETFQVEVLGELVAELMRFGTMGTTSPRLGLRTRARSPETEAVWKIIIDRIL